MTILAVDPGTYESAYVVWDGQKVLAAGKVANEKMLELIGNPPWDIDRLAVERIASYGMRVGQEIFTTCLWTGRFVQMAETNKTEWILIYRMDVKKYLVGSHMARDADIRRRLLDIVGPTGTKKAPGPTYGIKGDAWQALALAVTAWDLTVGK
ncbi:MAG TPA: hypothetical protein PLJ03_11000 [Syntrophales bacterium]|nr:hypothetical protein [Syntrophales bacterium]